MERRRKPLCFQLVGTAPREKARAACSPPGPRARPSSAVGRPFARPGRETIGWSAGSAARHLSLVLLVVPVLLAVLLDVLALA